MNQFLDIFINRIGLSDDSYMKTIRLINTFISNSFLQLKDNQLMITQSKDVIEKSVINDTYANHIILNYTLIDNNMTKYNISNYNILGSDDIMIIDCDEIIIPESETLDFYGCKLISNNDVFQLNYDKPDIELPLFEVDIGEKYVDDFLLRDGYGNGFYMEYHDTPHYHQPINKNASGYLVLGKFVDDQIYITKFRIPYGSAIYTQPYVLHSDAYLIGSYNVIYIKTNNYKTYLLLNNQRKIINVK